MYIQNKYRKPFHGRNNLPFNGKSRMPFNAAMKLPFIYFRAERVLQDIKDRGMDIQTLLLGESERLRSGIHALVTRVLKNYEKLEHALEVSSILSKQKQLRPPLARILIAEMLWGHCRLSLECREYKDIFAYKSILEESVSSYTGIGANLSVPRFCVRCNTLQISVDELIQKFVQDGFTFVETDTDYETFLSTVKSLKDKEFMLDYHAKDMLLFTNVSFFKNNPLKKNGTIVCQFKMNCLAAHLLAPPKGSTVLDFCAGPGQDTVQLATMVGKNGKVYSVKRDLEAYYKSCATINEFDIHNVKCIHRPISQLKKEEIDAEYIFIEPSCVHPGSSGLQLSKSIKQKIDFLRRVFEICSNVKRVVYTTRSSLAVENENVVKAIVKIVKDFKLVNLQEKLEGNWHNFGLEEFGEIGTRCLCAKPASDFIGPGFIAVFERLSDNEVNEFFEDTGAVPEDMEVTIEENENSNNDEEKSENENSNNEEEKSENENSNNDEEKSENENSNNDEEKSENDSPNDENESENDDSENDAEESETDDEENNEDNTEEDELINANILVKKSTKNKQNKQTKQTKFKQNGKTNDMMSPKMKTSKKQTNNTPKKIDNQQKQNMNNENTPKKGKSPKKQQNTPVNQNQLTNMEKTPKSQKKKNTPKNKEKTPNKTVEKNSPKRKQNTDKVQFGSAKKKQKVAA